MDYTKYFKKIIENSMMYKYVWKIIMSLCFDNINYVNADETKCYLDSGKLFEEKIILTDEFIHVFMNKYQLVFSKFMKHQAQI